MDQNTEVYLAQAEKLLPDIKRFGKLYRSFTGRPLGITGEVAEIEAIRLLKLIVAPPRTAGYDATRQNNGSIERIQIKSRVVLPDAKRGQKLGDLNREHVWDSVCLVLMNESFEVTEIRCASREQVELALNKSESAARKRGQLSVNEFKKISILEWKNEL